DGGISTMTYDVSHRLTCFIDPRGMRTSYAYDANGFVKRITEPSGALTTCSYLDWGTTAVTDPAGQRTTMTHNMARNIASSTDADGYTTTYRWAGNRLQAMIDGKGNRSTFTYAALTRRTVGLQSIRDAQGGIFTFVYDTNDRVSGLIDHLGKRSTLIWDG